MTLEAFTAFVEERGWKYIEEYVPAGSYEDPATGEVETWEAHLSKSIYRSEGLGDCVVYQQVDVTDGIISQGEQVWRLLVELGDSEFERRLEREKAAHA